MILVIVEDPFFKRIIEEAVAREGERCLVLDQEEVLEEELRQERPKLIFMDLGVSSMDIPTLVEKLKLDPTTREIPIVTFGSSIRADLMNDTLELGVEVALRKSSFQQQLPEIIRRYQKK